MVPAAGPIVKDEPPGEVPISEQIVEAETGLVGEAPISGSTVKPGLPEDSTATDQVYFHEGGGLAAEDFEQELAVIPEIVISLTDEVSIEDIKVGDLTVNTPEEIDQLRRMIWKKKHLLIGKGNALPPAARGVVCDIDVGEAKPIAHRVRKIAPQFREKVSDLLKGLLSAKIIQASRSPWASPIVVIIKKNGVDIRLCIDYRLVNGLTRLMIYPMPLINELLEGLDKVLWYCSLDMASGFWVVSMTDRARAISAFITPFGLFEWNRMPFGLKNAPQIYQRLLDNALYGFTRIPRPGSECTTDLIESGEPANPDQPSVLGRRSYIDDTARSWDETCERVEALLESCDQWNLSISVEKSYWGMRKVDYLGHQVSEEGLEAKPKDLSSLRDLPFPTSLRAMQSFLGSLNYYSRFLEG
ncbi:hypothetical protein PF005_g22835 [Phytophthora fragariae]|uniref:Reverse transcriptase domain-containing protein n=1 Tax=Phytophthora fragariae TaxID=53985 RepID=A0A6A3WCY5_9STRA|nr:hypothetical protein PF005_g22835 [Phytophthora fragariae]